MKAVVLTLFLVACASANIQVQQALENGLHPFSADMVNVINNAQSTWTAKQHFTEKDMDDVKTKMGTILAHNIQLPLINESSHFNMEAEIPEEFDLRTAHPECKEIIDDIRDQANCGSCWAFAAVGAMSDRICVASQGQKKIKVSSEDLLSCCTLWNSFSFCGFGCNGGMIPLAWRYWVKKGIVSGGSYDQTNTCRPYSIKPCGHHSPNNPNPCKGMSKTPKCKRQCVNGADYKKDKSYGSKSYSVRGEQAIQREIMQHGSVEAGFTVYSDFVQYESGVYQRTSNSQLGGHAVRLIGWGVENGTKYWTVANSWNVDWGQKGYFKILRGDDHCGIESQIGAGLPKL